MTPAPARQRLTFHFLDAEGRDTARTFTIYTRLTDAARLRSQELLGKIPNADLAGLRAGKSVPSRSEHHYARVRELSITDALVGLSNEAGRAEPLKSWRILRRGLQNQLIFRILNSDLEHRRSKGGKADG